MFKINQIVFYSFNRSLYVFLAIQVLIQHHAKIFNISNKFNPLDQNIGIRRLLLGCFDNWQNNRVII